MLGMFSKVNDLVTEYSWKAVFWGANLRRKAREERGQTTLEYMVIILIMVALFIALAMLLSPKLKEWVNSMISKIESAIKEAGS